MNNSLKDCKNFSVKNLSNLTYHVPEIEFIIGRRSGKESAFYHSINLEFDVEAAENFLHGI